MIQTKQQEVAASPCINVCRLDTDLGVCRGCFRTLDEISAWSRVDHDGRLGILAAAAARRQGSGQ